VGDKRGTEVEVALDLDAGLFKRLGIDLGDDELFGEILAADLYSIGLCRCSDEGCQDRTGEEAGERFRKHCVPSFEIRVVQER